MEIGTFPEIKFWKKIRNFSEFSLKIGIFGTFYTSAQPILIHLLIAIFSQ